VVLGEVVLLDFYHALVFVDLIGGRGEEICSYLFVPVYTLRFLLGENR